MSSVELWNGVTVSDQVVMDLARNGLLSRPNIEEPLETALLQAVEEARRYGLHPFVYDERDYFRALQLVRRGHPPERIVALYSQPFWNGTRTEDYGSVSGADGSLVKPSKDLADRMAVNRYFRIPPEKLRSHKSPGGPLPGAREVQYGRRFTWVPIRLAERFFAPHGEYSKDIGVAFAEEVVSVAHQKSLAKLLVGLRTPYDTPERHGRLLKALEDLERFPGSVLPKRGTHNNLMSDLRAAVMGNLRVNIQIIGPQYSNGTANLGYLVSPL